MTALQAYKGNPDDSINGTDREINFANQNHERLPDRQETQDRCVLADVANGAPIEPLLGIPQAEQSKYKNAADDDPDIWTSNESSHEESPTIGEVSSKARGKVAPSNQLPGELFLVGVFPDDSFHKFYPLIDVSLVDDNWPSNDVTDGAHSHLFVEVKNFHRQVAL